MLAHEKVKQLKTNQKNITRPKTAKFAKEHYRTVTELMMIHVCGLEQSGWGRGRE